MQPEHKNFPIDSSEKEMANLPQTKKFATVRLSIVLSGLSFIGSIYSTYTYYDTKSEKFGGIAAGFMFYIALCIFLPSIIVSIANIVKARSSGVKVSKKVIMAMLLAVSAFIASIIIPAVDSNIETNIHDKKFEQWQAEYANKNAQKEAAAEKAIGYVEKYGFYYYDPDPVYGLLETTADENGKGIIIWERRLSGADNFTNLTQAAYIDQSPIPGGDCYALTDMMGGICDSTKLTFEDYPVLRKRANAGQVGIKKANNIEYILTNGTLRISFPAWTDAEAQVIISRLKKIDKTTGIELLKFSDIKIPLLYNNETKPNTSH